MSASDKITAALSADSAANLTGWAAFPVESWDEDGQAVVKQIGRTDKPINKLKTAWFGGYGWCTFCTNRDDAVKEAVASRSRAAPQAALVDTTWLVARVTLTPQQVANSFKEKLISHAETYGLDAWRFYGDVPLAVVDHDSSQFLLGKLGVNFWASIAVGARTKRYEMLERSQCQNCEKHSISTWTGWCASCWNDLWERKRRGVWESNRTAGVTAAIPLQAQADLTAASPMAIDKPES